MREKLLNFYEYMRKEWGDFELEQALDAYDFETDKLQESYLNTISDDEVIALFSSFVYVIFTEYIGEDFIAMGDMLVDSVGLESDIIEKILEF